MKYEIKEMFYKPIERDIKGVIKVGQSDEENVKQELEEYVVTEQLREHIDVFFESYKKGITSHTDKMGVWISGFFGSGKSHLLKILSYLLDNKEIEGKKVINYFDDKKLDSFTLANMKKAGDITSDVILFNIDSKSEDDSKASKEAIVNVFNKVFNEMQGFSPSMPWLAELERTLSKNGQYDAFKAAFEEASGRTWEDGREDFYYEEDAIIEALASSSKMSEEAARNWYNKAEENYTISIESFAKKVQEYIESKGKNHHVLFLVDEIGQYIGENTKLMLNLQTVVEDLGTYCGGKCWVIVTSQEGLDEFTKVKGNDFSKIQGRFNTRLSLSSANVDEVIKERILRKKPEAEEHLRILYTQKESIIKNLLTFTDTAEMKLYCDEKDFADVYPFVPYQFNLLQKTFNGIREHGASGKHLSKGERSLLGEFQEVGKEYMNKESGVLVPFSAFYNTIKTFLDSSISSVIIQASKNNNLNEFDVEVLKLLFLIKYVKEIKGNLENLTTLLVSNIDEEKLELKKNIQKSLDKLIKETLVQKNGDEYIFLTNDEQDVNKEIKNIHIDSASVVQKIGEVIFEDIYKDKKFKYSREYNFPFNQIIDDTPRGSKINDIGIRIITPYYDLVSGSSENELKMLSSREYRDVIINISNDSRYIEELEYVLQIDSYLRLKGGTKATQSIEDIKAKKSRERQERLDRATRLICDAISEADIYINGTIADIKSKECEGRINAALKSLVDIRYNKLSYITNFLSNPKDLYDIFNQNAMQMTLVDKADNNKYALDEIDNHITNNTSRNLQITMKSILQKFSQAPFGWKELDIQGLVLRLFKSQEIRVIQGGESIPPEDKGVIDLITKREYLERVTLKKRERVKDKYVKVLKDLSTDIFDFSAMPKDEDSMMKIFKGYCSTEITKIDGMLSHYGTISKYPGKDVLVEGKEVFEEILNENDTIAFFELVSKRKDDLLYYDDKVQDIKGFFDPKGNQKKHFDDAWDKIRNFEENDIFITEEETVKIIDDIKSIVKSKEPYKKIQNLPVLISKYNDKIVELLEKKAEPVKDQIETAKIHVLDELNKYSFASEYNNEIIQSFDQIYNKVESVNSFAQLAAITSSIDPLRVKLITKILNRQKEEEAKKEIANKPNNEVEYVGSTATRGTMEVNDPPVKVKRIKNKSVSINSLLLGSKEIKNEDDIEDVLNSLRQKLKSQLEEDTIITLI